MALQMKLDELEVAEVNIKVSSCFHVDRISQHCFTWSLIEVVVVSHFSTRRSGWNRRRSCCTARHLGLMRS